MQKVFYWFVYFQRNSNHIITITLKNLIFLTKKYLLETQKERLISNLEQTSHCG